MSTISSSSTTTTVSISKSFPIGALRFCAWLALVLGTLVGVLFLFGPAGFESGVSPTVTFFSALYAAIAFGFGLLTWALLMCAALATEALLDIRDASLGRTPSRTPAPSSVIPARTDTRADIKSTTSTPTR